METYLPIRMRFAPSPNGYLHMGHGYSALLNAYYAHLLSGEVLLRIENIDLARSRQIYIDQCLNDLQWLGFSWSAPILYQSDRIEAYENALRKLKEQELVYPCFCSRKDIEAQSETDLRDPDGSFIYPGTCKSLPQDEIDENIDTGKPFALRLDMAKAITHLSQDLHWQEISDFQSVSMDFILAQPQAWGDVVLKRKYMPTSYHLSVVIDDAFQGITHVIRGKDLYHATSLHVLLQHLLNLPQPLYFHHGLMTDETGSKLSKSLCSKSLKDLRADGLLLSDLMAAFSNLDEIFQRS